MPQEFGHQLLCTLACAICKGHYSSQCSFRWECSGSLFWFQTPVNALISRVVSILLPRSWGGAWTVISRLIYLLGDLLSPNFISFSRLILKSFCWTPFWFSYLDLHHVAIRQNIGSYNFVFITLLLTCTSFLLVMCYKVSQWR